MLVESKKAPTFHERQFNPGLDTQLPLILDLLIYKMGPHPRPSIKQMEQSVQQPLEGTGNYFLFLTAREKSKRV